MEIENCTLCPRHCAARRTAGEGSGFCGVGADAVIARAALHFWEEPCISGTRGSGAVFFTGCTLKCVYCQNYAISTEKSVGKIVSPEKLAEIFRNLVLQGAHNINLVSADPYVPAVLRALELYTPPVPVVYNCSGYQSPETLRLLKDYVDVYLPDMKYADSELARRYSGASDYVAAARSALSEMIRQTGPAQYDTDGLMTRGTIVRHLILPGHTRDSIAVLDWLSENLPDGVPVSLMAQYIPCGRAAEFPEISRRITAREYAKVQEHLFALDLDGYLQERNSASKCFIPPFDLSGV